MTDTATPAVRRDTFARRLRRRVRAACGAVLTVALLSGCAAQPVELSGSDALVEELAGNGPTVSGAQPNGVTVFGCRPQTLLPHDSREGCGGRILAQLFSGLVELDAETGQPQLLVAQSIETDDARHWTIRVAPGWKFHNGEPVTAESFVQAWNFAASPVNGQRNRDFFSDVEGYDALQAGEADQLAGLQVIDDLTFEVTLSEAFAPFLAKLSDSAFYPLPTVAYEDLDAFERMPIGNGRFAVHAIDTDREIVLRRFADWPGADPAQTAEVTFLIYSGNAAAETAYLDARAGVIDVFEAVPAHLQDEIDEHFGERTVMAATASLTFLGLPMYAETLGGNVNLRRALSLSIDRATIIAEVLDGHVEPAASLIPPVIDAHRPSACSVCRFDPVAARNLLEEAGGFDGPLVVYHSAEGASGPWLAAVAEGWRQHLGIDEVRFVALDLAPYLRELEARQMQGPFSLRWNLSYLSAEYALSELYRSTGGANFFGYDNPAFDEALEAANAASPEDAAALYQLAEDIVLDDLPSIPLWYSSTTTVYSSRVTDVVVDARGYVRVERLRVDE